MLNLSLIDRISEKCPKIGLIFFSQYQELNKMNYGTNRNINGFLPY